MQKKNPACHKGKPGFFQGVAILMIMVVVFNMDIQSHP